MREIRFRIRDWCRFWYITIDNKNSWCWRKQSPDTIFQQYTWLKDSEWVEIFEGDIVKILYTDRPSCLWCHKSIKEHMLDKAHYAVVERWYNWFWLSREVGWYQEDISPWTHWKIWVISNIYENPDLVSKKESWI